MPFKPFISACALLAFSSYAHADKVCLPHSPCNTAKGPFFSLDYFYLQAKEDGLEYAQKNTFVGSETNPLVINAKIQSMDFEWNSGLKATLGYTFPSTQWDLSLSWTYAHFKNHQSSSTNPQNLDTDNLRPIWTPVLLGSIADQASALWKLNYNIINLGLGRTIFAGNRFSIRPHTDLKGVWIHQDYDLNYHAGFQFIDVGTFSTLFKNTSMDTKNHFNAIGISLGADTQWHFSKHFSLLANIAGTLSYGEFKVQQKLDGGFLNSSGGEVYINNEFVNIKETYWRLRPCFETELGLQWHTFFNCEKYRIAFAATYNFIYWPQQNELINSLTLRDSVPLGVNQFNINSNVTNFQQQGDLQLQGLKIELRMDF